MADFEKFEFDRLRGVVWVCDIVGSSKLLNNDATVDELESFLPRFYWVSAMVVEAAGGKFIKWTGDGFLAWFETRLQRELGQRAIEVFRAAWHLSFLINTTQLGIAPKTKFTIQHGVTYEPDGFVTKITHPSGHESFDIAGRAVVLAFRLSGIPAAFPGVVTQKELVDAAKKINPTYTFNKFNKWLPSVEERLRYFKGERWGTSTIYVSVDKGRYQRASASSLLRRANRVIALADGQSQEYHPDREFTERFMQRMKSGPDWCRIVFEQEVEFVNKEMLGVLKKLVTDNVTKNFHLCQRGY